MREILFRGKSLTDTCWIVGCFVKSVSSTTFGYITSSNVDTPEKVHLNTVGQYTGVKDTNGRKIFEGDIIQYSDIKGIINYNEGCYCVKTNKPDWFSRNNPAIDIVLNEYDDVEIIGNIHDNPELLKEEK